MFTQLSSSSALATRVLLEKNRAQGAMSHACGTRARDFAASGHTHTFTRTHAAISRNKHRDSLSRSGHHSAHREPCDSRGRTRRVYRRDRRYSAVNNISARHTAARDAAGMASFGDAKDRVNMIT